MKTYIVDDDSLSIFLTKTTLMLENATLDIKDFLSGTEALEALQSGGKDAIPDILFLDLNMPGMDGWEFLDAIEPLIPELYDRCSIYILTSSLDTSDTVKIKDYSIVSGLIHKPISSEDIELVFSQHILSGKNSRQ